MNSDKEMYSWNDRVVHIAHGKKHRIYFFRKSFDGCTTKNLKSLVIGITEAFENKYGVTYSPEVTEAIAKGFLDIVRDPLLNALFGGKPIDRSQILDFYEKVAVNDMSFGMAFVDLCIILGELERAMTFSRKVGKEFDLLKIVNETGGKLLSDVLRSHDMRMWLENAPQDLEHCRLNSMIFRAAQTASNEDHQLRPLLELWGEGYYWDAFCLVRLMFPTSGCLSFMKENIPKLVNDPNCCVMERVLKSLHEVNNGPIEMQGTILDDCLLPHLDPLIVYRLVKLDITRNEKTSGELEKLTIRAKCAQNLRRVLLLSLVHGRPQQTKAMSADAVAHIKTFGGGALGDYFPVAERMLFQSCMEMICDAVSAVTYAAAPPGYSTNLNLESSQEQGIINVLFAHWRATNPQIWCDKFGRDTFHQFSTGLLAYHVTELEKVYRETESYHIHGQRLKYLKLALKLGWLFSSDEFDCEMDVFKGIIGLAENSDLKNQAVMLAEKFTHNLNGKSKTSSIAPIHITGEQLISNIKMQQIEIPPIPKNVIPAHSGGVPEESVKIETVLQEAAHVTPNPVFHPSAQVHQLPGQPVNVLSDDGVNMNGVLDEMETKWEAPAAQMAVLVKEAAVDSVCHEEVAVIKDVSQNGVYGSKQIIDSSTNERTVVEEERKPEPVTVVRAAEVPAPCAVVVPAQPIHVVQPPVVSASFVRPVAKRADFSDDGWGDSPDPSPSKPLPPVDDKPKDPEYQERVQRMMDNAKVIMENAAQVKESVAPQMAARAVIREPVVVPAPQPIQDISIPPPSSASSNNVLDALLEKKTAAGDAPSVEQPKEEHVEQIAQEAVSAEPREGIASSAAEMAQAAVMLPPIPVVASPVAPAPSPVSKPSTPYKTGGFEAMVAPAGEGGFGSFTGGGSMGGGSGQRGGRGGGFGSSSGGFGGQQNGGGGFQGGPQRGGYTNGRGNFNGGPRGGGFRGRGV